MEQKREPAFIKIVQIMRTLHSIYPKVLNLILLLWIKNNENDKSVVI